MKRLKLIIAHEYMMIVGKKSFIVMTLLIPFIVVLVGAVPVLLAYLNNNTDSRVEHIAVIDKSGYGAALKDNDRYRFVVLNAVNDTAASAREFYNKSSKQLNAVVVIPPDVMESRQVNVYSDETLDMSTIGYVNSCLSDTLSGARVASYGIDNLQQIINETQVDVDVKSIKWDAAGGEQESSAEFAMILGMILSLVTYTFVLMYGAMIMNSVVEEKTNRIVEVIVSSCKPVELMLGKIIGVGLVGLTQFAVWTVLLGVGTSLLGLFGAAAAPAPGPAAMAAAASDGGLDMAAILTMIKSVNYASLLTNFVLYFVGGYLLYASLFAAFGSAVDQASDASQFTTPVILIMVVALYAGMACIENPHGPMAIWCSIIPFTSPVVMMTRLPYDVPLWQQALSIVLLFATAGLFTWMAARIYRTGILLYGKKRSFKDLIHWIK